MRSVVRESSGEVVRLAEAWIWQLSARCRDMDPAVFFHPDGERGRARKERQQFARAVCADCPVMSQCRAHALKFPERFGTWGGLSEDERCTSLRGRARAAGGE